MQMKLCFFSEWMFGLCPDDCNLVASAVGTEDVMFVFLCVSRLNFFFEFLKDDENVQIMFLYLCKIHFFVYLKSD